jgi:hypothetical protein
MIWPGEGARGVRGFKTWPGLVNAFTLCNSPIV